jgi:hypothetical protein
MSSSARAYFLRQRALGRTTEEERIEHVIDEKEEKKQPPPTTPPQPPFVGMAVPQPIPTTPVPVPRTTIEQAVNVFQTVRPTNEPVAQPIGGIEQISAGEEEKKYPQPDNEADSTTGLQMLSTSNVGVGEERASSENAKEGEEDTMSDVFPLTEKETEILNKSGKHIHLPNLLKGRKLTGIYRKLVNHPEAFEQHFGTEEYSHLMGVLSSLLSGFSLGKTAKKSVEKMLNYDKQIKSKQQRVPFGSSTVRVMEAPEKAPEPPELEVADDNATDAEKQRIAEANDQKMAEHNLATTLYEAKHASEMDELKKRNEMVRQGITNYEIQSNIINAGKKSELQEKIDKLEVKTEIKQSIASALAPTPQLGIGEKKNLVPYKALDLKQNTTGGVVFDRVYQDANRQDMRDFQRGELILQKIPRLKQVDIILDKVEKESESKILTEQPKEIQRVSVWERVLRRFPRGGVPIPQPELNHNYGYEERRIPPHYDDNVGRRGYFRFPNALGVDETSDSFLIT